MMDTVEYQKFRDAQYQDILADISDHLSDVAGMLQYEPLTDAQLDDLTHMVAEFVAAAGTVRGDS